MTIREMLDDFKLGTVRILEFVDHDELITVAEDRFYPLVGAEEKEDVQKQIVEVHGVGLREELLIEAINLYACGRRKGKETANFL